MKTSRKTLSLVIGGTFVATMAATSIQAAENPFAIKSLASGYMVAEADTAAAMDKPKDGKCGTGKCSASMKKAMAAKVAADKAHEGSCSADKAKEGSCHADKAAAAATEKAPEGSCSADKAKEGSCHADKK